MPANSGIGRSLPLPSQTNAGDIYVFQLPSGNIVLIHNGLAWIQFVDTATPQQLLNKTFDATTIAGLLTAASLAVSGISTFTGQVNAGVIVASGALSGASITTTGLASIGGALSALSAAITNAASVGGLLTTAGITASGRIQGKLGSNVNSASSITLGTGNVFNIDGTTNISLMDSTGWQNGSQVTLLFNGVLHVVDAAVPSGAFRPFVLANSTDFVTVSGCTLTLVLEANGWWEIARMVP